MGGTPSAFAKTSNSAISTPERRPFSRLAIEVRGIAWPSAAQASARPWALSPRSLR